VVRVLTAIQERRRRGWYDHKAAELVGMSHLPSKIVPKRDLSGDLIRKGDKKSGVPHDRSSTDMKRL
jgi:hypothetical protein